MKKTASIFLLAAVLLLTLVGPASAQPNPPTGACPPGFDPMQIADMGEMDMMHHHAGLKVDLNGDGWICMKAVGKNVHVHVDNVIPAP